MKIGFVLLIAGFGDLSQAPRYPQIREWALRVEDAGLDSIWLYDHLLYRSEGAPTIGIWECWSILSALAETTHRLEIGTLVLCNQFRNPAILAKMAHTIDEVSNGRLILGIGAGWNKPEFDAFGIPFDYRVDRFEEAVQIIRPLLKQGSVDFEGKYYKAQECEILPRSPRQEGPPLLIGSFGPRMMRLTAKYADMWNTAYLGKPEQLIGRLEAFRSACQVEGRNIENIQITVTIALGFPHLGNIPKFFEDFYLSGSTEEIAQALKGYEDLGVKHVIFHAAPYYHHEILNRIVSCIEEYRNIRTE